PLYQQFSDDQSQLRRYAALQETMRAMLDQDGIRRTREEMKNLRVALREKGLLPAKGERKGEGAGEDQEGEEDNAVQKDWDAAATALANALDRDAWPSSTAALAAILRSAQSLEERAGEVATQAREALADAPLPQDPVPVPD